MKEKINQLLKKVDKPARYCGGEFNSSSPKEGKMSFLMCFPDVYEVAHSNLGIKVLYSVLNSHPHVSCENCFCPWHDMAKLMQEEGVPLFSLESKKSAKDFDFLGFSLQYEMSYTNVLYMLDLGGIPLYAKDRGESDPLIIGGGPCAINPMPVADFFDLICIGDGEDVVLELSDLYIKNKESNGSKSDFLKKAADVRGVYVPSENQKTVKRNVVMDLDKAFFPTRIQIPNIEAVHNRAVLEIFRGCTRGCRFCQAGMIYRPVRERNVDTLVRLAKELIENNGYEEISISSLSTCDYPHLRELLTKIKPLTEKAKVNISLPSTRVDSFEADFVSQARKSSITFAPEAGTQRLRDVINKNVSEEDIFSSCKAAFEKGYSSIKLYFMMGLPTETMEDIEGIFLLAYQIKKLYKEHSTSKKQLSLGVSVSTFVPKPFTPFQWEKQISIEEIHEKQSYLRDRLKRINVKLSWHDAKTSKVEAVLARGGKELSSVIYNAYKLGSVYDGWNEHFDYERWVQAFDLAGIKMESVTNGFDLDALLAWDIIDAGVEKRFLLNERAKAYEGAVTKDCRGQCHGCGMDKLIGGKCFK